MAYCGNCGKPALEGDSFCYYCGAALQKAPTTNDAVQQAAAAPLAEETKDEPLPVIEAEPVTEEPIAEEPVSEGTAVVESAAEEPIIEEPIAEEPAVEEPIAEEPIAEEPTVEEPIIEEPAAEESAAEEPAAEQPIEQPAVMEEPLPMIEQPAVIEQPAAAPVVAVIPQPIPTANVTEEPAKAQKPAKRKDLLTAFQYIALTLLFHVPVVGLVFLFVWGCGGTSNISLKRFSLAMLILRLIGLILLTLCALCTLLSLRWGFGDAIMEGLRQLYEALRPIFG